MKSSLFLILIVIIFASCRQTNNLKFDNAQPETGDPLHSFDKKIRGTYRNLDERTKILIVENNLIRTFSNFILSCKRSEIDIDSSLNININNDQELIKYLNLEGGKTTIRNDSIFYEQTMADTLFIMDESHILKKFKGNFFLNYLCSDNYWEVKMIEIKKDTLIIGEITASDTLLRYDFIEKKQFVSEDDSSNNYEYVAKPTKRDLKKMIRSEMFERTEIYVKQ